MQYPWTNMCQKTRGNQPGDHQTKTYQTIMVAISLGRTMDSKNLSTTTHFKKLGRTLDTRREPFKIKKIRVPEIEFWNDRMQCLCFCWDQQMCHTKWTMDSNIFWTSTHIKRYIYIYIYIYIYMLIITNNMKQISKIL